VAAADNANRRVSRWAGAIIVIGILLRVRQYVFGRSLWFDEALLSLNILHRHFADLLQPLDNHQAAPIGFLMLERLAAQALGTSEYALRFVPLVAGIVALYVFYRVLRMTVSPRAALISLGLFALWNLGIDYSNEVKQYSTDTAVAVLLLWVTLEINTRAPSTRSLAVAALIGAGAIWFSHPAVFVLAGAGLCLTVFALRDRNWPDVRRLAVVYLTWAVSFGADYVVSLGRLSSDPWLRAVWNDTFVPWRVSYWTVNWVVDRLFGIFSYPGGIPLSGLGVFAFVVACTALPDRQVRQKLWIVMSPALMVLTAALLHRYPFDGRFLLFLVPSLLLFIGVGSDHVVTVAGSRTPMIGLALVGLLFFHPLWNDSYSLLRPRTQEEIRPILSYVRDHKQPGDMLYLYWRAEPAFAYYVERWHDDVRLETGRTPRPRWSSDRNGLGEMDALEESNWVARSE
jgi:hypothetical protein